MKAKQVLLVFNGLLLFYNGLFAVSANAQVPQYFFVGTYTDGESKGIYLYSLDPISGKLSNQGLAAQSTNPSFLAMTANGRYLLSVSEVQDEQNRKMGYVESFAVNKKDNHLTPINKVSSGGADPCYVSVNQYGNVLAANYSSGSAALFKLDNSGKLSQYVDIQQHVGSGPDKARQSEPHVHSTYFEPFSDRIFVSDLGTDQVAIYNLDGRGSKLIKAEVPTINITPGSGPRHLAFHPALRILYVVNELSNDISVITLNRDGSFSTLQTVSTLPAGYDKPTNCADIHISKDGRFLYASNRGFNTIAIFAVDLKDGKISLIGQQSTRGKIPRNFAISPNEDFLLVANQESQDIVSFRRDTITGKLEFADQIKAPKPVCLLFSK